MCVLKIIPNFSLPCVLFLQCQLVIDWLEKCAADNKLDEGGPEIGHFTDKIVAWENTLLQLKVCKEKDSNIAYGSSKSIVSRLDPDAPIRENKSLHDLDWVCYLSLSIAI